MRRPREDVYEAGEIVDAAPPSATVVKSAGRVLKIFELFDELERGVRINEISERLGYPQSSTSVLLKSLVEVGYLEFDPVDRSYLPTFRLALLGSWIGEQPVRDGALTRLMEELNQKTGDTIVLVSRNGIYAQYVRVLQATKAMRFHMPVGARRLLVWSGSGFALLADAPDDEIRRLVYRANAEAEPDAPKIDLAAVRRNVDLAREQGYFFSRSLVTPGGGHIAMRLDHKIHRRNRPLCIAVAGWEDDLVRREDEIVELMRSAVDRYLGV